ncbi:MAG: hypothetical protein ACI9UQ_002131 [Candidatus Krumholzibacteriia bacterium]
MSDATPTRYTERPLPVYRHVPGKTPHPTGDPAGHSYGLTEPGLPNLNQVPWHTCEHYLYGIDLFNAGYWWECHEVLEGLWHAAGHDSAAGQVLQAVIQCGAAHLQYTDQPRGARRLVEYAQRHANLADGCDLGVDLAATIAATENFLAEGDLAPAQIELNFPA